MATQMATKYGSKSSRDIYEFSMDDGSTTFVPIHDWAPMIVPIHVCARTRLCPHTFVPRHDCAQTRLCPHTFVPTHDCAQTRLCLHTIVPRHVCADTLLCPDTFVPWHVIIVWSLSWLGTNVSGHEFLYWISNKISTNAVQYIPNSSISLYSYTIWQVKIVHEARQHLVKRLEVLRVGNRWRLTHCLGVKVPLRTRFLTADISFIWRSSSNLPQMWQCDRLSAIYQVRRHI